MRRSGIVAKLEPYITGMTPEGERKLAESEALRGAVMRYIHEPRPEMYAPQGGRVLGIGKYSFTFFVEGIALKVSSFTSSQKAFDTGSPTEPDNLEEQFEVLAALSAHLREKDEGITTPEQFFVARTPSGAYLLGQQCLEGWLSLEKRAYQLYGTGDVGDHEMAQVQATIAGLRARIIRSLEGFALVARINDLALHYPDGLHAGNVMVPIDEPLSGNIRAAIIDQPTRKRR